MIDKKYNLKKLVKLESKKAETHARFLAQLSLQQKALDRLRWSCQRAGKEVISHATLQISLVSSSR